MILDGATSVSSIVGIGGGSHVMTPICDETPTAERKQDGRIRYLRKMEI